MANKVKFGLKNVYIAKLTETLSSGSWTYTYGTPFAEPGAVSLSLEAQGELSTFRADDCDYWTASSNNGYEGTWELALLSDDFKTEILGFIEDTNGVLYEDATVQPSPFAMMFEIDGDANARKHVIYRCFATRPAVSSSTTEEAITPVTDSITVKATARLDNNVVKASTPAGDTTSTTYTNWYSSVYSITE